MNGSYYIWGNKYPDDLDDIIDMHRNHKDIVIMVNEEFLKRIEEDVTKASKTINCQSCITYSVCMNKHLYDIISDCSIMYDTIILMSKLEKSD